MINFNSIFRRIFPFRKIKVVIFNNDGHTNNMISLYNELKADPRFDVLVIACDRVGYNFSPSLSKEEISRILNQNKIANITKFTYQNLEKFAPDYIFTVSPYDLYISQEFSSENLCKLAKLVHISYGTNLLEWIGEYEFLNNNPFLTNAYKIFVESKLIFPNNNKYHALGYLKIDEYVFYQRKIKTFKNFSIAWKPRWTGGIDSNLQKYIQFFYDLVIHSNITLNFIVHPNFFAALHRTGNEDTLKSLLDEMKNIDNINFIEGPNFLDSVLGSDIFISDISSTMAEFLSTNKPIIFTYSPVQLNMLGRSIVEACYIAKETEELSKYITNLMNNIDPKKHQRNHLFEKLFEHDPSRSVAIRLKEFLIDDHKKVS